MITTISNLLIDYYWYIALAHFILAVIIFFIINWIGARSISVGYMQMDIVIKEDTAPAFNFLFKVIAPVVFIILSAVFFEAIKLSQFNKNIYLIVVYYWAFRILWILCTSRGRLTNWWEQIIYWSASIGLSLWVYNVLENVEQILPDPQSLLEELWILIIMFIYSILNKVQISREGTIKRKNNYIISRYTIFKKKYDAIIKEFFHDDFYEALTYSIMIYEDFNRPIIVRWVEYLRFWITHKSHTLGIMQVTTDKFINDKESIMQAMQIIQKFGNEFIEKHSNHEYKQYYTSALAAVGYIANEYNGGDYTYQDQVSSIFTIIECNYSNIKPLIQDADEIINTK